MTNNIELPNDKPMFPISVVADVLKVHQRTLRIYDDENLLVPGRSDKNRRLYSINDIERGKFIQYLTRELGINLAGVHIIFAFLVEKYGEDYGKWKETLQDICMDIGISEEVQKQIWLKLSKRGKRKTLIGKLDQ